MREFLAAAAELQDARPGSPLDLLHSRPTVSVPETAQILSISRAQAYALANNGTLRVLRIGNRLVIPTAQLREMIDGAA